MSSFEVLKFIGDFSVHPLDPIFTDDHCLLETFYTFIIKQSKKHHTRNVPTFSNHKWQENKKLDFINNIDLTLVNQLHDDLRNAINQQSVNSNFINSISLEYRIYFRIRHLKLSKQIHLKENTKLINHGLGLNVGMLEIGTYQHEKHIILTRHKKTKLVLLT